MKNGERSAAAAKPNRPGPSVLVPRVSEDSVVVLAAECRRGEIRCDSQKCIVVGREEKFVMIWIVG